MDSFIYELKIPKERIAVLIGKKGETKKEIEQSTNIKINIDSNEGDINIEGTDAINLYTVKEVIEAIGRGFNPDIAKLLLKPDYCFEIVDLKEYVGKSKNSLIRVKGRVIGKEGKSRRRIEELSGAYVCVYGKTIGIIGLPEEVSMARQAIEKLLKGSPHSSVYKFLEKKKKSLKIGRLTNI